MKSSERPLSRWLKTECSEEELAEGWAAISARRAPKRWPRRVVAVVAIVIAAMILAWPHHDAPSLVVSVSERAVVPEVVQLSEGALAVVMPGAKLEALSGFRGDYLRLMRGEAAFVVAPRQAPFVVEANDVRVTVLGTRFAVRRTGDQVHVAVDEGRVQIEQGTNLYVLYKGQIWPPELKDYNALTGMIPAGSVQRAPRRVNASKLSTEGAPFAKAGSKQAVPSAPKVSSPKAPGRSVRAKLPDLTDRTIRTIRTDRTEHLEKHPEQPRTDPPDPVAALLDAADRYRAQGQPQKAQETLQSILSTYEEDSRSGLAAFNLGRIELENLGRPVAAARRFERALALGLPDVLHEALYARRVEAWSRAGDQAKARQAARDYLARFPKGRRAKEVRRWSY